MKRLLGWLIGLTLIAAACGQRGPTSRSGAESTGTSSPSSTAPAVADPLTGQWRQEFTCPDVLRTLKRAGFEEVPLHIIMNAEGAAQPPSSANPCADARGKYRRIARFEGGRLVLFDGPALAVGLEAGYQVVDDHTFTASDAGQNIQGSYTFQFQITGNRLAVKLVGPGARDPAFVVAWEVAPFHRTS
jgi:hypothetical protein